MCDIAAIMMTLSEFISASPQRTQQEWADTFGISRSFLSEILSGAKMPGRKTMMRIEAETDQQVPVSIWFVSPDGARGQGRERVS